MSSYSLYPEPPGLDYVKETVGRMLGLLNTKENYNRVIKEIEQQYMKPKVEYCDLCGKQFNQQWDSVTGNYFSTDKYPFIDKFICGSCAFKAHEWFMKKKTSKEQVTVIEQKEIEIPLAKKHNITVVEQKEVDKEKEKCNNCLYKIRDCKLKCNTCHEYSNYKEAYA